MASTAQPAEFVQPVVPAPKVPGGAGFSPSKSMIQQFRSDGFLVVRSMFTQGEVELVRKISKASEPESVIWLSADTYKEDVYNGVCHSRRIVETLSALLGDEVYLVSAARHSPAASRHARLTQLLPPPFPLLGAVSLQNDPETG